MKGRLIVIEGLDGSGKATQTAILCEKLRNMGLEADNYSFPDYESESSLLVRMYLDGKFGDDPNSVNPYTASCFFACDRYASYKTKWMEDYQNGHIIICDRYTTSNAVHQCSKLPEGEWDSFIEWLYDFEYKKIGIPEPDCVVYLRKKYATIGRPRTFMTSYGVEVSFTGEQGDYGWWMNWTKEQEELREMLLAGISGERTPVWFQRANSFGEHDYGDTYVEVNVTGQHVFFYKDGVLQMDTDCVTGNASRGNDTPDGVYVIKYKERNATLEGENYSSPVSYWMPFNGNIGLHDATWRWEFGSSLYLSSGSHGCVNLPYTFAKALYSMVQGKDEDKGLVAGTPVIVYHLPNTESSSITTQNEQDLAQAVVDAIDYIGEVKKTKECEKRITRARDLYNDLSRSGRDYVTNYDDLKRAEQEYDNL